MRVKSYLWKVLIVDDEKKWADCYKEWLQCLVKEVQWEKYLDHEIKLAYDGESALKIIKQDEDINIVICDIFMPPNCTSGYAPDDVEKPFGGIWLVQKINKELDERNITSLLISNKKDAEKYEKKWLRTETYKFVEKFSDIDKFKQELWGKTYTAFIKIAKIVEVLTSGKVEIVYASSKMKELVKIIDLAKNSEAPILILGNSGTGKELIAKYCHFTSNRKDNPFVNFNCNNIPYELAESLLFGHKKGAFTSAIFERAGCFKMADGGTLFLDEIGDLPLPIQGKLLKVIEDKTFQPLGSDKYEHVDVRIISATNKDIEEMVKNGNFREDLFYRLEVINVTLPPLSQRKEDIPLLIDHFLEKFNREEIRVFLISDKTRTKMVSYDWPGNVRQLENLIRRAVILNSERRILDVINKIPQKSESQSNLIPPEGIDFKEKEKEYYIEALKMTNNNISESAKLLGINPRTFHHRLTKFGLLPKKNSLK